MCNSCNYNNILQEAGLDPTAHRLHILEVIGANPSPLSATDVFKTMARNHRINRVTVYRILDLLVEKNVLERLSSGGRAAHYGLAPNEHHVRHPHFYCTNCGQMDCLQPESLAIDMAHLKKNFAGEIDRIEIRVDGTCKNCLRQQAEPRD